jgi:hypothetical protein
MQFYSRLACFVAAAIGFVLLLAVQSFAQAPAKEWDVVFGGSGGDRLSRILPTPDGGYILGGTSPSSDGNKKIPPQGHDDYWIVKTSKWGKLEWEVVLGGVDQDIFRDIRLTRDGGYIVGGSTYSNNTGDISDTSRGGMDFWIVKLNSAGNVEWDRRFGSTCDDYFAAVLQTNDGGYMVGGTTNCGPGGDKSTGARGYLDYWVIKTDSLGNMQWDAVYGGSGSEELMAMEPTSDGAYILAGISSSDSSEFKSQNARSIDYWMVKIDENGNKLWDKALGGNQEDICQTLKPTEDGGFIIGGNSFSNASGDKSMNNYTLGYDWWIVKTDSNGNKEWDKRYGTYTEDFLNSILQTPDGGYLLAGYAGTSVSGDRTAPSRGGDDYWIVKLNDTGGKEWDAAYGGSGGDYLSSAAMAPDGGIILGGTSASNRSADKAFDAFFNTLDYWVVKLAPPPGWRGTVSSNWNSLANWSDREVPTLYTDAIIRDVSGGSGNFPIIDGDFQVNNLTVDRNAFLTIRSDHSLTINGILTNNGTIIVEDGGSLIQNSHSTLAPGKGTFIIKRNISGGSYGIASPISNIPVAGFGVTPTGLDGGQVIPNQDNPCNTDSLDPSSPYGNIMALRENPDSIFNNCAQSLWHVKSAGTLENGHGYLVREAAATTLNFVGTVNNYNIVVSGLTRHADSLDDGAGKISRGWHLVGNPYPSPIEIDKDLLINMGFDVQTHRYRNDSWVASDPLEDIIIPVGQAFQVRKTAVGGHANFIFYNSMRVAGNPGFYRGAANRHEYLNIILKSAASDSDRTMVYFMNDATDTFDIRYDANRLSDGGPMVYTVAGGERLSYNALPTLSVGETKTVPLSVKAAAGDDYTLTFHDVNTLYATVMLEDKKLNAIGRVTEGFEYLFSVENRDSRDRFLLHFYEGFPTSVSSTEGVAADVSLFPNPTTGSLTLLLGKDHGYDAAVISDLSGKVVMNQSLSSSQMQTIDVRVLPKGIYFIRLSGSNSVSLKFIKQ